jgi:hypothetical protein
MFEDCQGTVRIGRRVALAGILSVVGLVVGVVLSVAIVGRALL